VVLQLTAVIETGTRLRTVVDTLVRTQLLVPLIESLAAILPKDTYYVTQVRILFLPAPRTQINLDTQPRNLQMVCIALRQEVALDILCRLYICVAQEKHKENAQFQSSRTALLDAVPPIIRESLEDPAVGAKGLLNNMRDHLNALNVDSPHVRSFPFAALGVEIEGALNLKRQVVAGGWIDMSRDICNVYVPKKDVMIKFPYHDLRNVHHATEANTVQLFFDKVPDKVASLLVDSDGDEGHDSNGDGADTVKSLYIEFAAEKVDKLEATLAVFRQRLAHAEDKVTDDREKRKKGARFASKLHRRV
jgi:hypothetical protein